MQTEIIKESSITSKVNILRAGKEYAKTSIGAPLGKFELTIRMAGQKRHQTLYGDLYDATDKLSNAAMIARFKKLISDEICAISSLIETTEIYEESGKDLFNDPDDAKKFTDTVAKTTKVTKRTVADLVKGFKEFPISQVCRILFMDTGFADEKHIILQFGRLKQMTEYATIPSTIDASLIRHQDTVFKASGWGFSLPVRRRLPDDLGKGYIDWIIPDDLAEESDTAVEVLKQANILADVIPYIHQEVYFDDFKKSNEAKVKTLEESLTNIKDTVKAMAVENDLLRMTITRLTRHGGKLENLNKHGLRELIYYAIPSLAGFLIGGPGGWGLEGAFGGVVLGLFVGAWLNSRGR